MYLIQENSVNKEALNAYFEKYGDIESIEIFKEQEAEETAKLEAFGYVTFQHDLSAFAAVSDNGNHDLRKKYNVKPADTWKQPIVAAARQQNLTDESMDEDEDCVPPIFMLNEDCFEELFKHLDVNPMMKLLEVCKKMNTLVIKHGFKHVKTFYYNIDDSDNMKNLAQMRRELKCTGKNINQLDFTRRNKCSLRFFQIMGKYVGNNIRYASFRVDPFDELNTAAIKPIFENLISLNVHTNNGIDLNWIRALCPHLTKLKLKFMRTSIAFDIPWPKLKSLSIYNPIHNSRILEAFLPQNPQITTFKMYASRSSNGLQIAAPHLSNVEKLTLYLIDNYFGNISAAKLHPLISLQKLIKITFCDFGHGDLHGITDCLKQIPTLRELKLFANSKPDPIQHSKQIQQSIVTLVQQLPHLEKLCLDGIRLKKPTVLEIIRLARNLKEIHIHGRKIKIRKRIFLQIIEIVKSQNNKYNTTEIIH